MELRPYYRTIVLSDIHLGTSHSKVAEVSHFLSTVNCDRLILNGDIIDGWHLQKSGVKRWNAEHTRFFKVIMKMMEKCGTEIIYVRGNHDDFLDNLAPLHFSNIRIVKDYTLESAGRRYFVTHGDVFDKVTTEMKWPMWVILYCFGSTASTTVTGPGRENLIFHCRRPSNRK